MFASLTEKSTTKKCESYCKKCSSLWYPSPPPPSIICGRWGPEYQEEGGGCTVQARNCTKVVSILSLVCSVLILLCFSCCGERSLQSFHCQTRIWLKVENCQCWETTAYTPRVEGSWDRRWKALLTHGSRIRSPAGNRTLMRYQSANWAPSYSK